MFGFCCDCGGGDAGDAADMAVAVEDDVEQEGITEDEGVLLLCERCSGFSRASSATQLNHLLSDMVLL